MDHEDDPDAELLLDWRGGAAYAAKLRMPPHQQSIPAFKQKKKATSGDDAATNNIIPKVDTTTDFVMTKNEKKDLVASADAVPVIYDLSDSEGTPIRPFVLSHGGRATAAAKACAVVQSASSPRNRRGDTEVVDLGSDTDEDIFPGATVQIHQNVDQPRQLMPQRGILEKSISLGDGGITDSISSRSGVAAADRVPDPSSWRDDASMSAAAANKLDSSVVGDERGFSKQSSVSAYGDFRPTSFMCDSGKLTNVAAECTRQVDSIQGLMGKCLQTVHGRVRDEEGRRSNVVQSEPVALTGDDGGRGSALGLLCGQEPAVLRGSRDCGGSGTHNLRIEEAPRPFLATSGTSEETGEVDDSGVDFNSAELLMSQDNAKMKPSRVTAATQSRKALDDVTSVENIVNVSKKSSRGKKRPVTDEERAAREAEKQRERESKKALQEEGKRAREKKKQELKMEKEAAKVQAAERKKMEKENDRWMKGKFALQNTTVHLDTAVVEMNRLGPLILGQLGDKNYSYKLVCNPIKRTVLWKMKRPLVDSQADTEGFGSQHDVVVSSQLTNSQMAVEEVEVKYVAAVFQGEEFSNMVADGSLHAHLSGVRKQYPLYSICYIINGLMKHLKQLEQKKFNQSDSSLRWPNIEQVKQVLAEFITHHTGVHSRLCIDEAEIADHLVGLTRSHADCPFKPKLTSVTVHANGDHVRKGANKDIIKNSTWLKFLVAIPNTPGATAIAIAKEYPTMRALLNVYLDPYKSEHEKESLLANIVKDPVLGSACTEGRRVGPIASRRIYRVLTAQDGELMTEDAEEGADHFTRVL